MIVLYVLAGLVAVAWAALLLSALVRWVRR